MRSSDSDSENECFESAEESLDENEEGESVKIETQKSLQSSEGEVAEPAPDCEPEGKEERQKSNVSLSFRKRPERVKRMPSKTLTRSTSKSPTNELIFKPDKIVPDVFFQDITNNLSKNINKSLSTLQQKSSNVKDLIFSSIPSSSANESEGFSYDDKSAIILQDEDKALDIKPELVNQSVNELSEPVIDKNIKNKEETSVGTAITKTDSSDDSEVNKKRKPPDIPNDSSDVSDGHNLLDEADAKGDICSFPKEEKVENVSPSTSEVKEDNVKTEIVPEKSKKSFNNSSEKNSEIITQQEGPDSNKINKTDAVSDFKNKKFIESKEMLKKEGANSESSNSQSDVERNLSFSETAESSGSIVIQSDLNHPTEETNKVETECNINELKMALQSIVGEEKVSVKSDNSNSSSSNHDALNIESDLKEKINDSKDGWDDFDFSDNEVENTDTTESTSYLKEKVQNVDNVNKKYSEGGDQIPDKKVQAVKVKESALQQESRSKKETPAKQLKGKSQTEQSTEPVDDVNWDWDAWDDSSQEKEDKMDVPEIEKPKPENVRENNMSDLSKWSGWETFGQKQEEKQGSWGLGSWGVDMLLNKATAVTQGISNVLEAGLGAPDPETLAKMEKIEREKWKNERTDENEAESEGIGEISKKNSLTNVNLFPVAGLTSLVAGVTSKIVEHSKIQEIGSKVITGGLDTLETFGKKTMEVLQEGDPGLKNKRALLLGNNKPVLSQVLREAREKADRESKKAEEKELARKCHFETLFDDYQGMIHLEALEMLSRQCELKLDQIKTGMNSEEQEDLNGMLEEVEQLCSLEECDMDLKSSVVDFKTALQMAIEPLKNEISVKKIAQIQEDVTKWLQMSAETEPSFTVINQKLVATLAELTAATVQQFHKSGELLSIKECRKTVEEVDALSRLTNVLCVEIKRICEKFMALSRKKTSEFGGDSIESFTEKSTLIMENSTSYIRQAFDLLIPVIQLGAAV